MSCPHCRLLPETREAAAAGLIGKLHELHATHGDESTDLAVIAATWHRTAHRCCAQYAVKRLVRGLGSAREGARQGFALALSELLTVFSSIPVSEVLDQIKTAHPVSSKVKGQQDRDALFGRVFGLMAVVRCGRVDSSDATDIAECCAQLINIKTFMPSVCAAVLVELCDTVDTAAVTKHLVQPLKQVVCLKPSEYTGSTLQLLLHLEKHLSPATLTALIPEWAPLELPLLRSENIQKLSTGLLESSNTGGVHPVWDFILGGAGQQWFAQLWEEVVNNGLLASSHDRKSLAMSLVERLLITGVAATDVPLLLSSNLMGCLINSLSNKDTVLHERAKEFAQKLTEVTPLSRD